MSAKVKTLYDTLNLQHNASDLQIRQAYRKLALKWHPDKNFTNRTECLDLFQNLTLAYRILSNKQSRMEYDTQLLREYIKQQNKTNDFIQQALNQFNNLQSQSEETDKINQEMADCLKSNSRIDGIYKKIRKYLSTTS